MSIRQEQMAEERVRKLERELRHAERELSELVSNSENLLLLIEEKKRQIKDIDSKLTVAMESDSY